MDSDKLRTLHRQRFREIPFDCGRSEPGIVDVDEWRDWSHIETTPDQLRIEDYLDRHDLRGKSILHIGIGNSGLAKRFSKPAERILGTTIEQSEIDKAAALGLPNYSVVRHNKYAAESDSIAGTFDFIVDNNPSSFCCCLRHFGAMLDFYRSKLAPDGQIVTDREGLKFTPDSTAAVPRFSFSFDDLAESAALAGLHAYRMNRDIIVLAQDPPSPPSLSSRAMHLARSFARRLGSLKRLFS